MEPLEKENIEQILPLDEMQKAYFLQYINNPNDLDGCEQICLSFNAVLNKEYIAESLELLSKRHNVLRLVFRWKNQRAPLQIFLKSVTPDLRLLDLGDTLEYSELDYIKQEEINKGFNLEVLPYRICCVCMGGKSHVIITNHHILYDGWSNSILISELFSIYNSLLEGKRLELPPSPPYYECLKKLNDNKGVPDIMYWEKYLDNFRMNEEKHLDIFKNHKIETCKVEIPEIIERDINKLAKDMNITTAAIYTSLWGAFFHNKQGVSDALMGFVQSGRNILIDGVENMVGLFIQTCTLRISNASSKKISDFLKDTYGEICKVSSNVIPLHEVRKICNIKASSLLYKTLVVVENYPISPNLSNKENMIYVEKISVNEETSLYPTTLEINKLEKAKMTLKYWSEYLSSEKANALLNDFLNFLSKIAGNTNSVLSEFFSDSVSNSAITIPSASKSTYSSNDIKKEYVDEIISMYSDILEIPSSDITPASDFFELGGHSLYIMSLILSLRKKYPYINVNVQDIYQFSVVKDLANFIAGAEMNTIQYQMIPKAPQKGGYLLSSSQKRLFFLQRLNMESNHYNLGHAIRIVGKVDLKAMEKAMQKLMDVHEILKSYFILENDELQMQIDQNASVCLEELVYEKDVNSMLEKALVQFDLSCAPLIKVSYAKVSENEIILLFQAHHIIMDEWSQRILINDFIKLYNGDMLTNLPEITYKDFAEWQSGYKIGLDKHRAYWLNEFRAFSDKLVLNTDYISDDMMSFVGDTIQISLEKDIVEQLRILAKQEGVSLFIVLIAMWYVLMNKLSGQNDIVIGTVSSGRTHPQTKNLLGMFTNTLPIRVVMNTTDSFKQIIHLVEEKITKAIMYQDYQYEDLIADLNLNRDINSNPLFDISFVMHDSVKGLNFLGDEVEPIEINRRTAKHYCTLFANDTGSEVKFDIEYRSDLFSKERMSAMGKCYCKLLEVAANSSDTTINSVNLMDYAERSELSGENNPSFEITKTIQELFAECVQMHPEKVAVFHGNNKLSYKEINEQANRIAETLAPFADDNTVFGIYMENSIETISSIIGILKLGCSYLPIDGSFPRQRIEFMLEDCGCRYVLVSNETIEAISVFQNIRTFNATQIITETMQCKEFCKGTLDDSAYIIYTSGSTGLPKGCVCSQKGVVNYVKWAANTYFSDGDYCFPFYSSIAYDLTVTSILTPLISGQSIVIYKQSIDTIKQVVQDPKVNIIKVTPTHLKLLLNGNVSQSNIDTIIVGGEQFSSELATKTFESFGENIRIYNEYGPTECVVGCIVYKALFEEKLGAAIPIGKSIMNMYSYILDEDMNLCLPGRIGEIYIGGVGVSKGYVNREELTREKFIVEPFKQGQVLYKTGDLAYYRYDGCIVYCGRKDNQVKIRGYRIEIGEIEKTLLMYPEISDCIVNVKQGKEENVYFVAYYVSENEQDHKQIKSFLASKMPNYMIPDYFIHINKIPLGLGGKVDFKALPKPSEYSVSKLQLKPRNEIEEWITQIWKQYLEVDEISIDSSFFDLGGNSFIVLKVHDKIIVRYPFVKITDLFRYPSIKQLSEYIQETVDCKNETIYKEAILDYKSFDEDDSIAIIGIGFDLKNASSLDELAQVFHDGVDCVGYIGKERASDVDAYKKYLGEKEFQYTQAAFLNEIDKFDFKFFNISKKEADLMDPYQRLFMQVSYRAIEDAGYTEKMLLGSKTGIYLGSPHSSGYYEMVKKYEPEMAIIAGPGNIDSIITGRISYLYDLRGPNILVDTACSSSLQALNVAINDIQSGRCDMAIVGGMNLIVDSTRKDNELVPAIVSSTARAHTFSRDADGTGRGEGIISLVIKPFKQALSDGDGIYAVIKGIASNSDGRSAGITAPNPEAQEAVILEAWNRARIPINRSDYLETHGTGTELGDPIEISAISSAMGKFTNEKQICAVGAAKTNYGHLDSASGLLGVLKMVVSIRKQCIYPNINMYAPNPKIDFIESPVYPPIYPTEWISDELRVGGISSFGLSGTNCHVVIQEESSQQEDVKVENNLFILSVKSKNSLLMMVRQYVEFLEKKPDLNLFSMCYTLQCRRNHFKYRVAVIFTELSDLKNKLCEIEFTETGEISNGVFFGVAEDNISELIPEQMFEDATFDEIKSVALAYTAGSSVDWKSGYKRNISCVIDLPQYAFEKVRCWVIPENNAISSESINVNTIGGVGTVRSMRYYENKILERLTRYIADMFGLDTGDVKTSDSFFALGIDSVSVLQLVHFIKNEYGLDISVDTLLNEIENIQNLTKWITEQVDNNDSICIQQESVSVQENVLPKDITTSLQTNQSDIITLFRSQLDIINQQMQLLSGGISHGQKVENGINEKTQAECTHRVAECSRDSEVSGNNVRFLAKQPTNLSVEQSNYLKWFIELYNRRTQTSKNITSKYRSKFASGRVNQGFAHEWKKIIYPIIVKKGFGSHIYDADENEYIDFAMGFGVHLLGYNHPVIENALIKQMQEGYPLGALTELPGQVAEMIIKMTGVERVAFCNSGTEAIMNIVRLARAATGKDKIVIFSGSFHGTFDGVYMMKDMSSDSNVPLPISLGTPLSMTKDVVILEYGSEKSLEYIRKEAPNLAAVLVEPVQSRNPELQPKSFLHELRKITSDTNVVLIFDEIISGFRIHQGGAQAYFGIQADLVAYGKIVGGGLPIGIFAGKASLMDMVDGGMWNYEDNSAPSGVVIQSGGTFCHHPLAMGTALAMLQYLHEKGEVLQETLNRRTSELARYLNEYFDKCEIPLQIAYFGSQFIFKSTDRALLRFMYYGLIYRGIYIWEGGTCYISTEHTEHEIAVFASSVQDIISELVEHHCFSYSIKGSHITVQQLEKYPQINIGLKASIECGIQHIKDRVDQEKIMDMIYKDSNIEVAYPLNEIENVVLAHNIHLSAMGKDISFLRYEWNGLLNRSCFEEAWSQVIAKYSVLRSRFIWHKMRTPVRVVSKHVPLQLDYYDLSESSEINWSDKYRDLCLLEQKQKFSRDATSLIRILLIKVQEDKHKIVVKYRNSLFDGWSANIIMGCLLDFYHSLRQGNQISFSKEFDYGDYLEYIKKIPIKSSVEYWKEELKLFDEKDLNKRMIIKEAFTSAKSESSLSIEEVKLLEKFLTQYYLTANTIFLGCWAHIISKHHKESNILIPVVTSGRTSGLKGSENMVGLFSSIVPLQISCNGLSLEWLSSLQKKCLSMIQHSNMPIQKIAEASGISPTSFEYSIYHRGYVFLNYPTTKKHVSDEFYIVLEEEDTFAQVPMRLYIDQSEQYKMILRFDADIYKQDDIDKMLKDYRDTLIGLINN